LNFKSHFAVGLLIQLIINQLHAAIVIATFKETWVVVGGKTPLKAAKQQKLVR